MFGYDFTASLQCLSGSNNGNGAQSNEQDVEQCVDRGGNELQRSIEISKCGCVNCQQIKVLQQRFGTNNLVNITVEVNGFKQLQLYKNKKIRKQRPKLLNDA